MVRAGAHRGARGVNYGAFATTLETRFGVAGDAGRRARRRRRRESRRRSATTRIATTTGANRDDDGATTTTTTTRGTTARDDDDEGDEDEDDDGGRADARRRASRRRAASRAREDRCGRQRTNVGLKRFFEARGTDEDARDARRVTQTRANERERW